MQLRHAVSLALEAQVEPAAIRENVEKLLK